MASTSKKTLEFSCNSNVKTFTNWIKRFTPIDKSILLEIDLSKFLFLAKSYNEEHSVVKMSAISFDDAGLSLNNAKDNKRIKIGIFNITHLIKIFDQFNSIPFYFSINYQDIIKDNSTDYAAEKLLFKTDTLKIDVDCCSLDIFKYIPDDLFTQKIAAIDIISSFDFTKQNIEKINVLNNLDDSEESTMKIGIMDNKNYVSGKTYELLLGESKEARKDYSLAIFKSQYSALDIENYDAQMGEDRVVFKSKDSDTITVISMATQ